MNLPPQVWNSIHILQLHTWIHRNRTFRPSHSPRLSPRRRQLHFQESRLQSLASYWSHGTSSKSANSSECWCCLPLRNQWGRCRTPQYWGYTAVRCPQPGPYHTEDQTPGPSTSQCQGRLPTKSCILYSILTKHLFNVTAVSTQSLKWSMKFTS